MDDFRQTWMWSGAPKQDLTIAGLEHEILKCETRLELLDELRHSDHILAAMAGVAIREVAQLNAYRSVLRQRG